MKGWCLPLLFGLVTSLSAWDFGGTLEVASSAGGNPTNTDASLTTLGTARFWLGSKVWNEGAVLARFNVSDTYTTKAGQFTNTVSGGLETLTWETRDFRLGRTDYRDFSGQVLDTRLDGVQVNFEVGRVNVRAFGGTSMFLFKSGSTIILSEDDTKDRQINEDWTQPSTLWAPRRVIAGVEIGARQWVKDQTFQWSLLAQADLRPGAPNDGDRANTEVQDRQGAPVSTAYSGLGWSGRVVGPLYGGARGFVLGGRSLTAVGLPETIALGDKGKAQYKAQTWRTSYLLAGYGSAELMLLVPSLSYLLVDAGFQLGSWDPDGPTSDKNAGESPASQTPTLYTGWTSISRTGGALLFNPQPANVFTGHLNASFKPGPTVQISSSNFVFFRPTVADISESGVDQTSQELYLGVETDLMVLWKPASDLGLSLGAGLFSPNPAAMTRTNEYKLQASANVSF